MQAPNRLLYKSEVRASVCKRVKTPCEQGLPHRTYVLQAEQRLPSATEEKAKRSFPMERDPLPSTTLRVIRSARSGLGQRSFRSFLCPTPKVTPRSSLGDVGEARWPLSHRWTDMSSTLPDAANDSRNQGRVVSLSELSLLSACVRLCQLREVHHSLQQSLNPERPVARAIEVSHQSRNYKCVENFRSDCSCTGYLFERSEFLIDTSQKKSLHACPRVRLLLVLVLGRQIVYGQNTVYLCLSKYIVFENTQL